MHIKPFQAVYPNLDRISETDLFFESMKEDYTACRAGGFFERTRDPAIYIYRIREATRDYTGIVACADIGDYLTGKIKKHENTLADKEQKQLQLFLCRKAEIKPVLLGYPVVPSISSWTDAYLAGHSPFFRVFLESEHREHLLWEVRESAAIRQIQKLFRESVPAAYIADGHHRTTSTALLYQQCPDAETQRQYSRLLCAFFPSSDLIIHGFNRLVEGPDDLSLPGFLSRMAELFEVRTLDIPQSPVRKHQITMFVQNKWYLLDWKSDVLRQFGDQEEAVDSHLLHHLVLKDILDIRDFRTDRRITYIEGSLGANGILESAAMTRNSIGFCIYPMAFREVFRLADQGKVLPPKSTWFEPRMKNGLIVLEAGG